MKKALLYLLLLSYFVMLLKPLVPLAADMLAHIFWKYEHIATVHHEHGSYHLHYELEKAAEQEEAGDVPAAKTDFNSSLYLHAVADFNLASPVASTNIHSWPHVSGPLSEFDGSDYPPPRS